MDESNIVFNKSEPRVMGSRGFRKDKNILQFSHPKCGRTWVLHLFGSLFNKIPTAHHEIVDFDKDKIIFYFSVAKIPIKCRTISTFNAYF